MSGKGEWYMAGSEKTGEYVVIAKTSVGRIGYRDLGDEGFRVRLEPAQDKIKDVAKKLSDWKRPNGQQRFSKEVEGGEDEIIESPLYEALKEGLMAMMGEEVAINPNAKAWAKELVATCARAYVVKKVKKITKKAVIPDKLTAAAEELKEGLIDVMGESETSKPQEKKEDDGLYM